MDFLDPAKKQAHQRRLFLGYFLMGVAIVLAASILLILSNGYDLDRKTGKVIQNGLIFTASAPESANIYLNGKANGQTDERITVPEGKYNVELRRDGYDTWKKTLQLDGGSIERLVYPRLFPTKLQTAVSRTYDAAPGFISQSPDRRWLVAAQPGQLLTFDVYELGKPTQAATAFTLPDGILSKPAAGVAESLVLVEWSTDNRHILVKHIFGDAFEFVVIDRSDVASSYNLNKLIGQNPTLVTLRDKRFDKLHIYTAETKKLQFVDAKTKAVVPVLDNVVNYKSYQDNIVLFTAEDPALPGKHILRILEDGKSYDLRTFEATGTVLLDLAKFDGSMYVAAASSTEGKLYIYKDPLTRLKRPTKEVLSPFVLIRFANPTKLSFSTNTRFVALQSGTSFTTYDFEDSRRFSFKIAGELTPDQFATWMDGHRLVVDQAGSLKLVEFDGNNQRTLSTMVPGTLPFFDRDYERLYTLSPVANEPAKAAIIRTSLKYKLQP